MFCPECGTDMGENNICQQCGTRAVIKVKENKDVITIFSKVIDTVKNSKYINKKNVTIVGISLFIVLLFVSGIGNHKTTVSLNEFVDVNFSGYDTIGHANISFDYDSFKVNYGNKIEINKKAVREYLKENNGDITNKEVKEFIENIDVLDTFLDYCVYSEWDKDTGLCNGDTVTYSWKCLEEEALKYFNVKLKYSDIKFTVVDLLEAEEFDPFENVVVEYKEIAPYSRVIIQNNAKEEMYNDISFWAEPNSQLKNGDEIVLRVNLAVTEEEFIEKYGKRLSVKEKVVTVEGLDEYILSKDNISDNNMKMMKERASEIVKEFVGQECDKNNKNKNISGSISNITYIDEYFLVKKNDSKKKEENRIYLVYQVDISETMTATNKKKQETQEFSYYMYISYSDLINDKNGKLVVDLDEYQTPVEEYVYDTGNTYTIFNFPLKFEYKGYETLELFYEKCISNKLENYVYEE